jgi:hypothetical protein
MCWYIFFGPRRSGKTSFLYSEISVSSANFNFVLCTSKVTKSTCERALQKYDLSNTSVFIFDDIESQLNPIILQQRHNIGSIRLFVDNGEFLTRDQRYALSLIHLLAPPNTVQIIEVQTG